MKVSVVIPAYNASRTIDTAIQSVLAQTVAPGEILVLDDGSSDDTCLRLESYQSKVTVFRQSNHGAAHARNHLIQKTSGEMVAFLDADDIWHPQYIETQLWLLKKCPDAVASFTGHVNFRGTGSYSWVTIQNSSQRDFEVIDPVAFLEQYNRCPGPFGSMSFCCIPKRVLAQIGDEPFPVRVTGAEDFCLMNMLPCYGPVVRTESVLAAYRETPGSLSSNRLEISGMAVKAFEFLANDNRTLCGQKGGKIFKAAFASKRRNYAKFLLGAGRVSEARMQLKFSLANGGGILSLAKSLGLLLSTYLPTPCQPGWPPRDREQPVFQEQKQ